MNAANITLISLACTLFGALMSYLAFHRNNKKDNQSEGASRGQLMSDVGYIKSGVDDLKRESRETQRQISNLTERLSKCEERCDNAHKRIDDLINTDT